MGKRTKIILWIVGLLVGAPVILTVGGGILTALVMGLAAGANQ